MGTALPTSNGLGRPRVRAAAIALTALFTVVTPLALAPANAGTPEAPADWPSPRPHAVGDVLDYSLRGTMSAEIKAHDAFGRAIRQQATPTLLVGRERIAVKSISPRGLALHRSGSIIATFKGKSSPAQSGSGWTLVSSDGIVQDRKGSTLGGLFLLPLGFLGDRSVNDGAPLAVGAHWQSKLGVALFGMAARPLMRFEVTGTREIFGTTVYTLSATGTAPIVEPIVTNDAVPLGNAKGTAHITLHCDFDPHVMRTVSMDIDVIDDLHIVGRSHSPGGDVHDEQHYLVALDAASINADVNATATPAASPDPAATAPPRL
jgi:hypothetical protein